MFHEEKDKRVIQLIKNLPKYKLSEDAEERILHEIKLLSKKLKRRINYTKLINRISLGFMAAFVIMGISLFGVELMKNEDFDFVQSLFPQEEPWEVSPLFNVIDKDGRVVYENRIRGMEGKIGFLEAGDFIVNEPAHKMFWYVWGDREKLAYASLEATAVHQKTGKQILLNKTDLEGAIYGEDGSALTSFEAFPIKGLWRIDVFINDEPYGSIVVHVKDEYVKTENIKFLVSKDDLVVGSTTVTFEVRGDLKEEMLGVHISSKKDKDLDKTFQFQKCCQYFQVGKGIMKITAYEGVLQFDEPGKYEIEVLGEKVIVKVNQKAPF